MSEVPSSRSRRSNILPLAVSLLAIIAGVVLITRPAVLFPPATPLTTSSGQASGLGRLPREGEAVPDFELKTLDGGKVKLSNLHGSPVLINFWATWCGPCKEEMPLIVEQYNWDKGHGLRVLAIDSVAFDNLDDIKKFVGQYKMTFDVLLDEEDQISSDWAINGLPSSFFIKPDGTIAKVHVGQMSADQLKDYLKLIVPN